MTSAATLASSRLKTPGGIPYAIVNMSGGFGVTDADVQIIAVIRSSDLFDFATELMPFATRLGTNFFYWEVQTLPGFPSIGVDRITFKAIDEGKPIDPFGYDSINTPAGTYQDLLEVTIHYSSNHNPKKRKPDPNDPKSFLEISASTSVEVLNVYTGKSKWVQKTTSQTVTDVSLNESWVVVREVVNPREHLLTYKNLDTGEEITVDVLDPDNSDNQKTTNKDGGSIPTSIIVPLTNWSVKWPDVDYEYFRDTFIYRLRSAIGKVNSDQVGFLYDASPETLLFSGWNYTEKNSWRELDGAAGFNQTIDSNGKKIPKQTEPPLDITMNFTQRHILWDDIPRGWNDYWSNDKGGWTTLEFAPEKDTGTKTPYALFNFDLLFKVD